tara:strand:+ start:305 stop:547 length:243 start_codon:yes stop_codon:yes gene_type:complete
MQTFNPFVDFSDLNLEELLERKIELYNKLRASTPTIRPQVQIIIDQLEQLIVEKSASEVDEMLEEEEEPKKDDNVLTIGE